ANSAAAGHCILHDTGRRAAKNGKAMMMKSGMRPLMIRLCASVVAIMFAAAALELVARGAGGKPVTFLQSGSLRDRQTGYNVGTGVTDANLRVTCGTPRDGNRRRRVAVIGDSFVFGQGIPDCQDMVSNLQRLIPDAVFVNYGNIGVGIDIYQMV